MAKRTRLITQGQRFSNDRAPVTFVSNYAVIEEGMKKRARDLARGGARRIKERAIRLIKAQSQMPSPPGEPPFSRRGEEGLVGSFHVETHLVTDGVVGIVWCDLDYAYYLEFGTRYMAARPFLAPAYLAAKPVTEKRMREPWGLDGLNSDGESRRG